MHKNLAVHVPEWVNNGEVALQVDESQVPDDQGMDQQVARTVHLCTAEVIEYTMLRSCEAIGSILRKDDSCDGTLAIL